MTISRSPWMLNDDIEAFLDAAEKEP